MRVVLDTNILIDYLNGFQVAVDEIALYLQPCISPITWMEVMAGADDDAERQMLRQFLKGFEQIELSDSIKEMAAQIRGISRLRLPDAVILATATTANLMLVTRNTKDFDTTRWPNVRVPYSL